MPDDQAYLEKLRTLSEGKDPLSVQESTAGEIADLVSVLPESQLHARPKPDKWSIVEIVAHMADDELVTSWRYRQMLESPGCVLAGFDQDKWASLGRYSEWTLEEALSTFRLLRQANLRLLRALGPHEWESAGVHAERGAITVADLARHMASHDLNHLAQIRELAGHAITPA